MTHLLAIETSSEACSVALATGNEIYVNAYHEPRRHAELLLPAVSELLAEAGIALKELDAIAFGRGPGSFTSLRIGIGVVQGLAWGAELGVVPVSSLAVLAQGAALRHQAQPGSLVITAMDARMEEVFHAPYLVGESGLVELHGKEGVDPPGLIELPAADVLIGAGNGFERYPDLIGLTGSFSEVYTDLWPSAKQMIPLAADWLSRNQPLPPHRAQPHYIRDNVAAKSIAR
jgi:tRNA threonylcarbamoyladenosine biosynthesis protein TsaB